ncbi:MAG: type II secretion system minor pseudopilin GspK [Pseudomonadota bacterium]
MRARHHRGAALLAAMLTVALVASMAAAALWQQWRSVEVESAERARVQSLWVLTGALDWARLILREDARSGGADHLGEPWAVPLEEARLSTFLAAEKGVATNTTDAATQAFLSGYISDLQGRMNVLNLVENGKPSEPAVRAFAKLFEKLGLPRSELAALIENLRFAQDTSPNNGSARMAPLMPQRVGQLVWLGLSPRSLALLRPFVTLLPLRTPVNLNTASAPVLFATIPGLDMAQAERLVTTRQFAHFHTLSDVGKVVPDAAGDLNENQHSVNSRFFEIHGRLRLDQTVVDERSVVQRDGIAVKTLWRDRGAQGVQTAPLQ